VDSLSGAANDFFGGSVAINGDTAVIGAYNKNVGGAAQQGQAYVYVRSGIVWSQQAILVDSTTGAAGDFFGFSVGVSGDTAVIGAVIKKVGMSDRQGQAYVFGRAGTTWSPQAILVDAAPGGAGEYYGYSVATSGDTAVVSAINKQFGTNVNQGEAYVFALGLSPNGTPCTMGSECTSSYCVDGRCCDSACGGGSASDCQSCLGAQTGGSDGTCGIITRAARYSCRAATSCSHATYCDGSSASCPVSLCLPPPF
jgi:hypothetical protein